MKSIKRGLTSEADLGYKNLFLASGFPPLSNGLDGETHPETDGPEQPPHILRQLGVGKKGAPKAGSSA